MELAILCRMDIAAAVHKIRQMERSYVAVAISCTDWEKDVVEYILQLPTASSRRSMDYDWRNDICPLAAEYGKIEILQWANDGNFYVKYAPVDPQSAVVIVTVSIGQFSMVSIAIVALMIVKKVYYRFYKKVY